MTGLLTVAVAVMVIVFAGITIYLIDALVLSARIDRLLKKKNMFTLSDILLRERDLKRQEEARKKQNPHG